MTDGQVTVKTKQSNGCCYLKIVEKLTKVVWSFTTVLQTCLLARFQLRVVRYIDSTTEIPKGKTSVDNNR